MKKILLLIVSSSFLISQVNLTDIQKLTNKELDKLRSEILNEQNLPNDNQSQVYTPNIEKVNLPSETNDNKSTIFGYNYFEREVNFFDNIPTPSDYLLGPGDELVLSMWGEANSRETFTLNKEGLIYFEDIGYINLTNKTLKDAQEVLVNELSKIYSTLNDDSNTTKLTLELGKIKSINIYFSGQVQKPGINLIHPFSDIFTALIQAGGLKETGSLRNVQLIRNNNVVATVDFYKFFVDGVSSFNGTKLIDGDTIHVPIISSRVQILGEVISPGFYELLESESLLSLINYAGGLTPISSNSAIITDILPLSKRDSNDNAKVSSIIDLSDASLKFLTNGASIKILQIGDNDTEVSVFGRVLFPGEYPATSKVQYSDGKVIQTKSTLKSVLDLAGGFYDSTFRKTIDENIIILRLNENKYYGDEFIVDYKDSESFLLEVNDKIFVYENPDYENGFMYTILGEVNRPGVYPLKDGTTLSDAVKLAGGITQLGSINSISITKTFKRIVDNEEINETELVSNIKEDFIISDQNVIRILPKTNVVRVGGNVYNPGLIAFTKSSSMSMSKAIELAGGYKPYSIKRNSYVVRANGEIEKVDLLRGRGKRVFPGDSVFVPVDPNPSEFNITSFIADLSSTLANIAAILVIADRNGN